MTSDADACAIAQHPQARQSRARPRRSERRRIAAGLAPDGGLYVPERMPRLDAVRLRPGRLAGRHRRHPARAVLRRRSRWPPSCRRSAPRRSTSRYRCAPWPRTAAHRAGAVPRPDRRVQGCRRALPRRLPARGCRATDARPLTILVATSGDTGAAVGAAFHRRAGRARGDPVSGRPGVAAPGAPARLLRRQRHGAARGRPLRRLPAHGQGRAQRHRAAGRGADVLGQQHQPGPAAAADELLRPCRAAAGGARTASR